MDTSLADLRRRLAAPPAPPPIRRIDGWVAGFCAAVLALAGLAAWGGSVMVRQPPAVPQGDVSVAIAGRAVTLPRAWLRDEEDGAVDLRIPLDAFGAPAAGAVLVRVAPRGDGPAPAERATQLYARFLSPAASAGEGGLIRREFRAGSPYEGEILYLAPPDGRAFAARCADRRVGAPRETCLAEIRAGAADVQIRLAPEHLGAWQAITRGLQRLVGS